MNKNTVTARVNKIVSGFIAPGYVSDITVHRSSFGHGCYVRFNIANHGRMVDFKRFSTADNAENILIEKMTDINDNDLLIAIGKTVIPTNAPYGWSNLDRLKDAGIAILTQK